MPRELPARPASRLVRAGGVSARKVATNKTKTIAKKTVAKKKIAKKTVTKKAIDTSMPAKPAKASDKTGLSPRAFREKVDRVRASVEKAKATKAATQVLLGAERPRVDPADEVGTRRVDAKFAPWERAAGQAVAANAEDTDSDAHDEGATPSPRKRRSAVDRLDDPPPATGLALIKRVTGAIERELSQIEVIVGGNRVKKEQRSEAERRARTLASLARTLTELKKLRGEERRPGHDNDRPRDLDELRKTIFERLGRAVGARATPGTGGDALRRDGSDQ